MIWECQFFLFFKYVIAFFIGIQISRWNCFLYWFMFQTEDILWVRKCGVVVECRKVNLKTQVCLQAVLLLRVWGNVFIPKKFDPCKIMSEKFDIYNEIFFRDVGNFFRHLCELVLRHQMRVSNYFVNSFYSVGRFSIYSNYSRGCNWQCGG